jgi:hypothetical protein
MAVPFRAVDADRNQELERVVTLRPYWPRILHGDWGFDHFSAFYLTATDGDNYYTYREYITNHKTAPELAHGILEMIPEQNERKMVKTFYMGPDVFAKKTSDRTVAIEIDSVLTPHGFGFSGITPAAAGPGDRVLRWSFCYQLLKSGKHKISPDCPELIKAIPAAVRDYPLKGEDCKKTSDVWDDCRDAWGMGLYTSSLSPRLPIELEAAKLVTVPMSNLTGRALQYREAMQDVRRRRAGMSLGR